MPDAGAAGAIEARSNLASRPDYHPDAVSEQDYLAVFCDTNINEAGVDGNDNRPHIPLNIKVFQNSYAWSYDYAEDFILFDYHITNMGVFPIRQLYMAFYVDADVLHRSIDGSGHSDGRCDLTALDRGNLHDPGRHLLLRKRGTRGQAKYDDCCR